MMVMPRIMPTTIAAKIAKNKVNLKTRKNRGNNATHRIIVKQPVAKSFASNILVPFKFCDILEIM